MPTYTAAELQAERDQHIEVAAEQATSAAVKIAEEKMSQIAEQEKKSKEKLQKEIAEQKVTIDSQLEKATAHLRKMRKANIQTEENIKAQSTDIQNLSVSIIETTGAISGLQRSVRGLEKNAGHMSVAMNNLT